ncbi:DUF6924 domain-containing protein [Actinomadura rupiterrae]|uniref:DUF6924 domain-containing protein n=1 Tax=Actinomadura rupiterrae TaxID=559627 RepID=UPI0020A28CA6|nr:hypothetical protein [Actinomadura rupiterrae]MCP2342839.1 hypothetical protein [Actinomadura rupiterrae]
MAFPELPQPAPGEPQLLCTSYDRGKAQWGGLLREVGGRREGDLLVLADGRVRLRLVESTSWDSLDGGNVPAIVPEGGPVPPVAVLADGAVAYGGDGPLLVDLAAIPGRGVRVPSERLGEILADVLDGTLTFDDLVRGMDVRGMYQGGDAEPEFTTPTGPPPRTGFPALPASDMALLVRACFDDEDGWQALLAELGGVDEDGWVGSDLDVDQIDPDRFPLTALVVDDRAFEDLQPGQVPALVPPEEHTTMVMLADARTFGQDGDRTLTVVDLHDTPGQIAVLPWAEVGSMACNLEIANMDFHEFVAEKDVRPWWLDGQ